MAKKFYSVIFRQVGSDRWENGLAFTSLARAKASAGAFNISYEVRVNCDGAGVLERHAGSLKWHKIGSN